MVRCGIIQITSVCCFLKPEIIKVNNANELFY
jgi:hypothetical protein